MSSIARHASTAIPDLSGLAVFLALAGYTPHASGRILDAASRDGTAAAVPEVDPEDEPEVERLIEEGYRPVPAASHEWGSPTDDGSLWRPEDDRWTIGPGGGWSEQEIEQARRWHARNDFQSWLAANGGPKHEDPEWPTF
jgi:hypothetical protein